MTKLSINKKNIYLAIIVIVTAAALLPSLFNNFVNFDDPQYVVNNELIKKISAQNIGKILTRGFVGCYCPIAIFSYMAEYHFFGLNPFIYHLTNYLFHIAISVSIFYFIWALSESMPVAFIVALLFGIHPLHVESVAWISERKDMLSTFFYILALSSYLHYVKENRRVFYFWCIVTGLLSLLSKPMAVTLPFVLILIDYFRNRKFTPAVIYEKVPFFILSAVFGAVNYYFQSIAGVMNLRAAMGVKAYFLAKAIPFYLGKVFVPLNLCGMYLYHNIGPRHLAEIKYYVAALLTIAALIFLSRRYSKKVVFGSLFFIITLLPVLKVIPAGDSFAADRYMYLPSIGIFYIIAVFFEKGFAAKERTIRYASVIVFVSATIALSIASWQRCGTWEDTESFYLDVIKRYPDRTKLYNELGAFLSERGDLDKAIRCFEVSLALDKENATAAENLKKALVSKKLKGLYNSGEKEFRASLDRAITTAEKVKLLNKFGLAQGQENNIDKAIELFKEAIALDPLYADSYHNLGYAYYIKGEPKLAEEYFRKALAIDPNHRNARMNLDFIEKNREYLK